MAYIDVDTLLNKLHIAGEKEGAKADDMAKIGIGDACIKYNHGQYCYINAQEIVKTTPTADVVEVRHSRWENISGFDVCNICGTSPAYCEPKPNNPKGYPPYCHNCGAKMDGKDNNVPTK